MTTETYRAGILTVAMCLTARIEKCLPPEHRVAAVSYDQNLQCELWLIEGPMMPVVEDQAPGHVNAVFTASYKEDCHYYLQGRWEHQPKNEGWKIGEWPDQSSFRTWFGV